METKQCATCWFHENPKDTESCFCTRLEFAKHLECCQEKLDGKYFSGDSSCDEWRQK